MSESVGPRSVLVAGDVVVDHFVYHATGRTATSGPHRGTRLISQPGGAAVLARLLSRVGAEDSAGRLPFSVTTAFDETPSAGLSERFAIWSPVPKTRESNDRVWRATQSLGYGGTEGSRATYAQARGEGTDRTDVIAIDDRALGFRFSTARSAWPGVIGSGVVRPHADPAGPRWVILDMAGPLCAGDLWRALRTFSDRLVVLISGEDLRREQVQVSRGLSWERTALDLAREFERSPVLRDLASGCRHLVVSLGVEGAVWCCRQADGSVVQRVIYDPRHAEGEWQSALEGTVVGLSSCLTAAVAARLVRQDDGDNLQSAITTGLSAMHVLCAEGHGAAANPHPDFPFDAVAREILAANPTHTFAAAVVPPALRDGRLPNPRWAIMVDHAHGQATTALPLYGAGRRVAMRGPDALGRIPHAHFAKLFTVDRDEIEGLRALAQLIDDYRRHGSGEAPLSIGVFGPPGSGKSFCVKQIAKAMYGERVPLLEFNLSQYSDPRSLVGAFHQIRDKVLEGTMPFVFWDEFDSYDYRWLQYLLAPMQDGRFSDEQFTHPIGKSVFICAGGTSYDFDNFGPPPGSADYAAFRSKKGPDFKSRVIGRLDVRGPNRRQLFDASVRDWVEEDPGDICFPVRRALLVRATLGLRADEALHMDDGILSALLEVGRYRHGARSLQKIVSQLGAQSGGRVLRSALPQPEVMSIHVDYEEFMRIVNRDESFRELANQLAPLIHEYWRPLAGASSPYNVEFARLPDEIQEDNRAAAERLVRILALIGLRVVPATAPGEDAAPIASGLIEANLEMLAEEEHDGWMEQKRRNGWVYAEQRDDAAKQHPSLRPYHELSSTEQEKDRNSVRKYPELLRSCGWGLRRQTGDG